MNKAYKTGMFFGGGMTIVGLLCFAIGIFNITAHWSAWMFLLFFILFFGGNGYYCGFHDGWNKQRREEEMK